MTNSANSTSYGQTASNPSEVSRLQPALDPSTTRENSYGSAMANPQLSDDVAQFVTYHQSFAGCAVDASLWRTPKHFPAPRESFAATLWLNPMTKAGLLVVGGLVGTQLVWTLKTPEPVRHATSAPHFRSQLHPATATLNAAHRAAARSLAQPLAQANSAAIAVPELKVQTEHRSIDPSLDNPSSGNSSSGNRYLPLMRPVKMGHQSSLEWSRSAAQPSTAQPSTAQPSTAQPSTAQPSTAQPSTAQPSTIAVSSRQPFDPKAIVGDIVAKAALRRQAASAEHRAETRSVNAGAPVKTNPSSNSTTHRSVNGLANRSENVPVDQPLNAQPSQISRGLNPNRTPNSSD